MSTIRKVAQKAGVSIATVSRVVNGSTAVAPELRDRVGEIPDDKPIVVHCAAGYRSAAAASIIASAISSVAVYDLGEAVIEVGNQKSEIGH